jgi:hypothetical protein
MHQERRKFLQQLALACTAGVARSIGVGAAFVSASTLQVKASAATAAVETVGAVATVASSATISAATAAGFSKVRSQVMEVIVRQGVSGAPWREICWGPMKVNNIDPEEIEQAIQRRKAMVDSHEQMLNSIQHSDKAPCACNDCVERINGIRVLKISAPPPFQSELYKLGFGQYKIKQ